MSYNYTLQLLHYRFHSDGSFSSPFWAPWPESGALVEPGCYVSHLLPSFLAFHDLDGLSKGWSGIGTAFLRVGLPHVFSEWDWGYGYLERILKRKYPCHILLHSTGGRWHQHELSPMMLTLINNLRLHLPGFSTNKLHFLLFHTLFIRKMSH